jgi:hypothetical protein
MLLIVAGLTVNSGIHLVIVHVEIHRRGQGGLGGLAPAKLKVSPPQTSLSVAPQRKCTTALSLGGLH